MGASLPLPSACNTGHAQMGQNLKWRSSLKWYACAIDKTGNCRSESRLETDISWKYVLENGADLCVNEGQALSEYRASLAEGRRRRRRRRRKVDF